MIAPEEVEATGRPKPFRRILAVYDRLTDPGRLVYWKDWSKFGLSYEIKDSEEPGRRLGE
jgi:hypothetical protein